MFEPKAQPEPEARLVTLEQLYAFRDKLNRLIAARGIRNPLSESERHSVLYGHRLSYGCCRSREGVVSGSTPPPEA